MLARSWPCFEVWLRLHFGFHNDDHMLDTGGKTAAQNCVDELRHYLSGYEKAAKGVFLALKDRLEARKGQCYACLERRAGDGDYNPSTEVHELVDYLQSLNPPEGSCTIR